MEIIDSGIGKLIRPPDLDAFREWYSLSHAPALPQEAPLQ